MKLKNYSTTKQTATVKLTKKEIDTIVLLTQKENEPEVIDVLKGFVGIQCILESDNM